MLWKQDLRIPAIPFIEHDSSITAIGSCFSNHIGQYLANRYFNVLSNPLGILFNPVSIEMMIDRALKNKPYSDNDTVHHLDTWHLIALHGSNQDSNQLRLLDTTNRMQDLLAAHLKESDVLLITLGTATVYRYLSGGYIAGNNHKLPLDMFEKSTLQVVDVRNSLVRTIRSVRKVNPAVKIILTVSPVRHLRDGPVQNLLSKSTLIVASHSVLKDFSDVHYFPAYEILMDELRDYRFYKEDLVHPSDAAVEYIWTRFVESHFTNKARLYLNDVDQMNAMEQHRPLFPESSEHQKFLYKLTTFKKQLMSQWNINLPDENKL